MQPDIAEPVTQPVAPPPPRGWRDSIIAGDLAALWPAIVVAFLAVLAVAFGMSYHGLFVFGERIMGWALGLCIAAPVGLDVFSLLCLIATFLTRDAHWRVRLYCWLFLGLTVALSIAGNGISAYAVLDAVASRRNEHVEFGYAQVSAIVGASFWPLLAAIALHVLIVVRRHLDERRDRVRRDSEATATAEAVEQVQRGRAIELIAEGKTVSDVLADLKFGESQRRSVERWTKAIRDAMAGPRVAVAAKGPTRRVTARATDEGR